MPLPYHLIAFLGLGPSDPTPAVPQNSLPPTLPPLPASLASPLRALPEHPQVPSVLASWCLAQHPAPLPLYPLVSLPLRPLMFPFLVWILGTRVSLISFPAPPLQPYLKSRAPSSKWLRPSFLRVLSGHTPSSTFSPPSASPLLILSLGNIPEYLHIPLLFCGLTSHSVPS